MHKTGRVLQVITGKVSFKNVQFSYPTLRKRAVLNDFTVEARAHKTLAFVGASGCGKSTTAALVERYYDVLAGSVVSQ